MLGFYILLFTICLLREVTSEKPEDPTARLDNAVFIGQAMPFKQLYINQFLGIPYAEPPIGDLRFKLPNPLSEPYEGTIMAKTQPPACPQYTTNPYPWYYNGTEKSEDCLYLNIWTPAWATSDNKKSVLFWIHGGGFRYGSIRQEWYEGTALSSLSDVVVVTVNYRVGPFGFLYTGTEEVPGNAGLWDIVLGLEWVNRYIEAFGGDKSKIIIVGQDAGSYIAGLFTLYPLTKNYFQRLIMESGTPLVDIDDGKTNLELGDELAALAGCGNSTFTMTNHPEEVIDCLRGIDYEELSKLESQLNPHMSSTFSPIYGDILIPEDPRLVIKREDLDCKDLLIGVNRDEGTNLVSTEYSDIFGFFGEKDTRVNRSMADKAIRKLYDRQYPSWSEAAVEFYLPENLTDQGNTYRSQMCIATGDYSFYCPSIEFANQCARNGRVYFYHWQHRSASSVWAKWEGVTHFSEVDFVFGLPVLHADKYDPRDGGISHRIIRSFASFAKYGAPEGFWPLYSESAPVVLNLSFDDVPPKQEVPHLENCKFVGKVFGYM